MAQSDPQGVLDAEGGSPDLRSPSAAAPAVIGRIIGGNFRVLKLIGAGAMGHVFQAEQLSLGKMVALKLLRRELQADEKLTKRFELEAKNASSLDHPNSIQIIDFGRDGDLLYIAMELLPGVDLGQLILREGPLPFSRLGRIMDQVLGALDEAHAHGIVHRDLKPGNIMLVSRRDDPDFVKVCDFGIAKAQSSTEGAGLTLKGLVCGTPEYMSPEQARGEDVDGRSDLYSVGVILYQLVTGDLPFSASSPVGILSKHLAEPPVPPSLKRPGLGIPPALESVILHALAKDPADRPGTADQLRRALRAALAGLPESLATPTGSQPAPETYDALGAQSTTPLGLTSPVESSRTEAPRAAWAIAAAPAGASATPPAGRARKWWPAAIAAVLIVLSVWLTRQVPPGSSPAVTAAGGPAGPAALAVRTGPAGRRDEASKAAKANQGRENPGQESPAGTPAGTAQPAAVVAPEAAAAPAGALPAAVENAEARPAALRRRSKARAASADTTVSGQLAGGDAPPLARDPAPTEPAPTGSARPAAAASPPAVAARVITRPAAHDAMKEAEHLLAQGNIAGACQKGEEQLHTTPSVPAVYRFLGKCYMRAGQPAKAMPHYRRYLELYPDAPDAAFVRSIVR